jgi:hypothetical protein
MIMEQGPSSCQQRPSLDLTDAFPILQLQLSIYIYNTVSMALVLIFSKHILYSLVLIVL